MAYDQSVKDAVRAAYVYKNLSLKDSARLQEINYQTARAWKTAAKEDGDCWDSARNAARMVNNGGMDEITNLLLENFALQSEALLDEVKSAKDMSPQTKVEIMSKLSDSYAKLVASSAKSGSKVAPLALAMNVIKLLTEFIKNEYPEHINVFMEILEPFGARVARELG